MTLKVAAAGAACGQGKQEIYDLEKIKALPIIPLGEQLGAVLTKGAMALCIFPGHIERTPSLHFESRKNTCFCFGCRRGGSVIDLVKIVRDCDFKDAVRWLADIDQAQLAKPKPIRRTVEYQTPVKHDGVEYLPDLEVYASIMKCSPLQTDGRLYLNGRFITDQTIKKFSVGQIPNADHLVASLIHNFGYPRCEKSGVLAASSTPSCPRLVFRSQHIVFPFLNGEVATYLQARSLSPSMGSPKYIGLRGVRRPVFNLPNVAKSRAIWLCEGIVDVLSAYELNKPAIGLLGASTTLRPDELDFLSGKTIYIVGDNDRAGRTMVKRLRNQFVSRRIISVIQTLPPGTNDLNEHLVKTRRK
ncbi:CHC2 zinc finger domain-containing protein [Ferrovibrio sp.]|uniref:CHC2 zinc finger domain-containing protein n=1 Tax=Ferrovibrio sp. TaxID=1917215 RepID=UPI000CA76E53|nr:CHC2 zinc finger domain-containing protein [Ferrovibrio sp.]PJI42202.1 MAG: hypothetical protein CTR53_07130 [Ferrovibrio sp.]